MWSAEWQGSSRRCHQLGRKAEHQLLGAATHPRGDICWLTVAEGRTKAPEPGRQAFSPCSVQPGSLPKGPGHLLAKKRRALRPAPPPRRRADAGETATGRQPADDWPRGRWAGCPRLHFLPVPCVASVTTGMCHTLLIYPAVARRLDSVQFSAIVTMAALDVPVCVF